MRRRKFTLHTILHLTHTEAWGSLSKTRGIPRTFKDFWKVYWWSSFVEGSAKFRQRAAHGLRKTVLHTCPDLFRLFKPLHTCSHLFRTVQNCWHLFTPVQSLSQTFSNLFTSVHNCSYLRDYALCAITFSHWIFPLRELLFFNLRSLPGEIAYFSWPNR